MGSWLVEQSALGSSDFKMQGFSAVEAKPQIASLFHTVCESKICVLPFRTRKHVCIFCLYNKVAEELYFLACFLSWRLEGPPVGCLARGLAHS